jgi:hypothetical protein
LGNLKSAATIIGWKKSLWKMGEFFGVDKTDVDGGCEIDESEIGSGAGEKAIFKIWEYAKSIDAFEMNCAPNG